MCHRVGLAALVLFSTAVTGGCGEKPTTPTIVAARAQFFVADVPVPEKFDLDRRKSADSFRPGHREIKHIYVGRTDPQLVGNFYRLKMTEYQWELIDRKLKNGVEFLNYRKGDEKCAIRIEETPNRFFGSTTRVCVEIQATD